MKVSPLAPVHVPQLPEIGGVRLASCEAGIRYKGRKDLLLAVFEEPTTVAGVLTKSKTASAPVDFCRKNLVDGKARALVVNSGNANAFTGQKGADAVQLTVEMVAKTIDCQADDVFVASTGVIGEPLEPSEFLHHIDALHKRLSPSAWEDAAQAIMTTDTYLKVATCRVEIDGQPIYINGIAKGSGMIAPDMATMLAFLFTDADIAPDLLQTVLQNSADRSFNSITVDGDTSTSDTVLCFATGQSSSARFESKSDPRLTQLQEALDTVSLNLAHQIVRDGEGASKFVRIDVCGAENDHAAHRIGLSIANSPLVKTAIAGEDPNWGRVVMAVGKAGEAADRDRLSIWFGDILVAEKGEVTVSYKEEDGANYMKSEEIHIKVDVGIDNGEATVWTCDFTHDYITINADYRS